MDSTTSSGALRVSDAEREQVAARLREAIADGRLTLAEADERQATAYAARTRADLAPLTADLPAPQPPTHAPTRHLTAAGRRRLGLHAGVATLLAVMLVLRWATGPATWFWPVWPMLWLVVSVLVHYRIRRRRWDRPIRPPMTAPPR